jgi:hypothetical protein
MLAAESAALPVASMRNGPISQSAGMARTTTNIRISAAKNRRNPKRRRRRRSDSSCRPGVSLTGWAAAITGAAFVTATTTGSALGAATTTGSALGAATTTGSALGAATITGSAFGIAETVSWTTSLVSVFVGWIGALGSGLALPPVSLSSRSCSFALSAARSCGCTPRQGRRRMCDHRSAGRLRPLFRALSGRRQAATAV